MRGESQACSRPRLCCLVLFISQCLLLELTMTSRGLTLSVAVSIYAENILLALT